MAYRRRQQQTSTAQPTGFDHDDEDELQNESIRTNSYSSSTSIAAKAIRASSAARRDSSLYSAYGFDHRYPSAVPTAATSTTTTTSGSSFSSKDQKQYEYTSMKPLNEPKQGFWGSLARKAKSVLEDDTTQQAVSPGRTGHQMPQTPASTELKFQNSDPSSKDNNQRTENRKLHKGLNAITSSLNYIGNAVEEGLSKVENRTADIIQETRKHIRKKPAATAASQNQVNGRGNTWQQPYVEAHFQPQMQTDQELQLKASRDVAMAMAAKAKLLLRELKTVKADLAFAKERCAQLEEENKILREHNERGDNPEDDDLIRLQLETLLSEKARLAHENSIYARENRFLREVVEYHQLTMQDVVYLDEGTEEVTEVYPIKVVSNTPEASNILGARDIALYPVPPPGILEHPQGSLSPPSTGTETEKQSNPWV